MGESVEVAVKRLLADRDFAGATTKAIGSYGPEVLHYLRSILRSEDDAWEAFSRFRDSGSLPRS